jgi:hypothetical protein
MVLNGLATFQQSIQMARNTFKMPQLWPKLCQRQPKRNQLQPSQHEKVLCPRDPLPHGNVKKPEYVIPPVGK